MSEKQMTIRPMKDDDRARVATLLARCYGAAGAHMIALVSNLREKGEPQEWVGTGGHVMDGYAMMLPVRVADSEEKYLLLAPLALNPEAAEVFDPAMFVQQVCAEAQHQASGVLVVGDTAFFGELGFKPAADYDISLADTEEPDLLVKLYSDTPPRGTVQIPAEFL